LVVATSTVSAYSNSADYFEATCYWEVTCIPAAFHSSSTANGTSLRIEANKWRVDSQNFGGLVYPKNSICGTSAWVKQSTYWVDSYGNHTIGNWIHNGAMCDSSYACDNYYSTQQFYLIPDPLHGNFYSTTRFGNDCLPVGSVSWHSLTVYP
jgi:hypothetical protein